MFGSKRRKSSADAAIEVLPEAIALAAEKWLFFCETLPMKAETPLAQRIALFSVPFFENLRNRYPALRKSPDAVLFLIVAKGVDLSGTHSTEEIERELGVPLPS